MKWPARKTKQARDAEVAPSSPEWDRFLAMPDEGKDAAFHYLIGALIRYQGADAYSTGMAAIRWGENFGVPDDVPDAGAAACDGDVGRSDV